MNTLDMNTLEFLSYLRSLEVKLSVDGERLRCSAPKGALTKTLQAELAERKAEILVFLRNTNAAADSTHLPIQPVPRDQDLPLSPAQLPLWFIYQMEPSSSAYNLAYAYRLKGQLNITALEHSLGEIVRRHETLRTTFKTVNGSVVQVISHPTSITLPVVDLQSLPEEEQSARVQQLVNEEAQRPFDLTKGPLLRVALLRLEKHSHVFLLTMHHIISDGWSMGVFFQELATLYATFCASKPSPLPELPIQYADFSVWQHQWLQGEVLEKELNYWRHQLAGTPPLLELPTDRPRPPIQTSRGSVEKIQLTADLTQKLNNLSQQSGTTLFMTVLAAFATLLYRYSGQEDVLVGSPIANRKYSETKSLIGFLLNTLVLRTNLEGNPSFQELLARVRRVALDAYAHQNVPFEKLTEVLQPERNPGYSPWFQVMFVLQNTPAVTPELSGLTLTPLKSEQNTAIFDLVLDLTETEQGLGGVFVYNTDLFDQTTITRIAGHFQTLLEGIVANPEQRISKLPLLSAVEQHQLLVEWNQTTADYPDDLCYQQLFEAQVERTPKATAVVHQGQELSYEELNSRANQLAHYLRSLGVKPDVVVGICLERSLEMAVGFLAILKAGGAYLPLDPNYPSERLAFMLEDSQAPIVLTQQRLVEFLPPHNAKVICLDHDWQAIAQHSQSNLLNQTTPENLAYLIYTSGSTGKPKGVMITHQGMVNHNLAIVKEFELEERDRVLQFASISFDIAVEEIFPTWLSGAALVLRSEDMLSSTLDFLRFVNQEQVTILDLPTAFWHEIVNGMSPDKQALLETVRLVVVGGEKASRSAYTAWSQIAGDCCRWLNTYGPTETTVTATVYEPAANPENDRTLPEIPIGRPIVNAKIYILDRQLQPVPIGVPGELHIGGAGLARGYLNRPDLTEQKFIANPFNNQPRARLYKTGDLVRYLPDGNIEFIGRIDNQVKIRGFRIELGEIEAVLEQQPAVQQAVVVVQEDVPNRKQLVAYLVTHQEQELTTSELRRFLQERLPDYMVPSLFMMLDAMPTTPNGKVDRRALPAPDRNRSELQEDFVAPQTPTQESLAAMWAEILGVEQISIHDNFFELGGHSLLAIQVISRLREAFQVELPLRGLFESPTLAKLAERIETFRWATRDWQASNAVTTINREEGEL
ncbi:MAG: amino acid adenylation domain-containing protein [Coleofasciculaceae cyanobacterium]